MSPAIRILGLGNELLADDAIGHVICQQLRQCVPATIEIITTGQSGFALLDYLVDADYLLIVDAILTGKQPPGTLQRFDLNPSDLSSVQDLFSLSASSPHFTGILEPLLLACKLDMRTPRCISILSVEVVDPFTVGGEMDSRVRAAISVAAATAVAIVSSWASHL